MIQKRMRSVRQIAQTVPLGFLLCAAAFGILPPSQAQSDPFAQLLADLKDPNPQVRIHAAEKLRDLKDPRAVDSLFAALKD